MISVVIPTMWRYDPLLDFLSYIVQVDVVKEVIIINNDRELTPVHDVLIHHKVRMYDFGKNIFVNPAWNFGVEQSTCDKVCILNDDLTFDLKLFYKVDEFLTPDMGCIGLSAGMPEIGQTPLTNGRIDFEPFVGQSCFGFGNLMFVHKKNWKPVPEGLDVWFGDTYIFDYYYFSGRQNYFISNMFHYHEVSKTSSSDVIVNRDEVIAREESLYAKIKENLMAGI